MNKPAKALRDEIDACKKVLPPEQWTRLDAAWRRLQPRKAKRKSLAPGKTRAERKAEEREHTAQVRAAVFARVGIETGGLCEIPSCVLPATDLHHIFGGGLRHAMERPETCMGVCRGHHELYDAADDETLGGALVWADDHGFLVSAKEVRHRIDKAAEARGVTG